MSPAAALHPAWGTGGDLAMTGDGWQGEEAVLAARTALEAALVVSESEEARMAWRLYRQALSEGTPDSLRAARRLLDDAVGGSGDDQLVQAKRRYQAAIRGGETTASRHDLS